MFLFPICQYHSNLKGKTETFLKLFFKRVLASFTLRIEIERTKKNQSSSTWITINNFSHNQSFPFVRYFIFFSSSVTDFFSKYFHHFFIFFLKVFFRFRFLCLTFIVSTLAGTERKNHIKEECLHQRIMLQSSSCSHLVLFWK